MKIYSYFQGALALVGLLALGSAVAIPPVNMPDHDYDIQYYADDAMT